MGDILIPEYKIKKEVRRMAHELSEKFEKCKQPPIVVGVLNGAYMFFTDLTKNMGIDHEVDFIRAKSYHGKDNSGGVTITKDIEVDVKGRDVIIVEDIIDTGATIKAIRHRLKDKEANTITIVTLIKRKGSEDHEDYHVFEIDDSWIIGYGFDDDGIKRNYRNIYKI